MNFDKQIQLIDIIVGEQQWRNNKEKIIAYAYLCIMPALEKSIAQKDKANVFYDEVIELLTENPPYTLVFSENFHTDIQEVSKLYIPHILGEEITSNNFEKSIDLLTHQDQENDMHLFYILLCFSIIACAVWLWRKQNSPHKDIVKLFHGTDEQYRVENWRRKLLKTISFEKTADQTLNHCFEKANLSIEEICLAAEFLENNSNDFSTISFVKGDKIDQANMECDRSPCDGYFVYSMRSPCILYKGKVILKSRVTIATSDFIAVDGIESVKQVFPQLLPSLKIDKCFMDQLEDKLDYSTLTLIIDHIINTAPAKDFEKVAEVGNEANGYTMTFMGSQQLGDKVSKVAHPGLKRMQQKNILLKAVVKISGEIQK